MSQNTYPRRRRVWPWILLAAAVALVAFCTIGAVVAATPGTTPGVVEEFAPTLPAETPAAKKATTTPAKPAKPAKPAAATVDDGTWTVGDDIPAGTYKVNQPIASGSLCYWAITKTGSNGGDIVANDLPSGGRPSVVVKRGQDFETNGCGTWTKTK